MLFVQSRAEVGAVVVGLVVGVSARWFSVALEHAEEVVRPLAGCLIVEDSFVEVVRWENHAGTVHGWVSRI